MLVKSNLAGVSIGDGFPVRIMGVVNVSPESFYKGSVHTKAASLGKIVDEMTRDGADFIDVGAMSTAPYLETKISEQEEARRIFRAVSFIRKRTRVPISVDTSRFLPAEAGLRAGAKILNDVNGLADARVAALAKKFRGVILMAHPRAGVAAQKNPTDQIKKILERTLLIAKTNGVAKNLIAIDPGIGFFRNEKWPWWKWDVEVLRNLKKLASLHAPILIGVSRKSFIGRLMGGAPVDERLPGSLAATIVAVLNGAKIIRTHDVKETKEAVRVAEALRS